MKATKKYFLILTIIFAVFFAFVVHILKHQRQNDTQQKIMNVNLDIDDRNYLVGKDEIDRRRVLFITMAPDINSFDRYPPLPIDAYLSVMRKTKHLDKALFWADSISIEIDSIPENKCLEVTVNHREFFRALAFEMGKEYDNAVRSYIARPKKNATLLLIEVA